MKIYMIAKSNIRRNKGISTMLILLILIATILLYTAFSVLLDIDSFIDEKNKELNGAEYFVEIPEQYSALAEKKLKSTAGYQYSEKAAVVFDSSGEIQNTSMHEKKQTIGYLVFNADTKEELSKLKIIDQGKEKLNNSIILPYFLKISKGYQTGDKIIVSIDNQERTYIVYGFAEDIMFATPTNISYYKCYVYDQEFRELYKNQVEKMSVIKCKLEKDANMEEFNSNFVKSINSENIKSTNTIMNLDYASMKIGLCMFLNIIMAILIVFSFIIIVIILTVIRFTIVSHIENNIKNLGSMQAIGYRPIQLVLSIVTQFVTLSIIGYLLGLLIALFSSSAVKTIVSSSIGLRWQSSINILAAILSFGIMLGLIIMVSLLTSIKIKKITPIAALRCGIETHNFKRNYFSLSKGSISYNTILGMKSFMYHMRQNITIIIVVMLMSFVSVFAFVATYNFDSHEKSLLNLVGMENAEICVTSPEKDNKQLFEDLNSVENVRKTVEYTEKNMTLKNKDKELTTNFKICSDYSMLETNTVIKGRYPQHDNEIAITSLLLKQLHAKLGDVIRVKDNQNEVEFLIVGVTQQISYLGKSSFITNEGMKKLNSSFVPNQLYIYLKNSNNLSISSVSNDIYNQFKEKNLKIDNLKKITDTTVLPVKQAIIIICLFCIIITQSIIALILYLFIKIRLLKERIRIGVAKALGYTTKELIYQVVVSFCPTCIIGALLGTFLARFLINPAFALMLSTSGIVNCDLVINGSFLLLTFVSISLFALVITMLVSVRVRKITPRELFD